MTGGQALIFCNSVECGRIIARMGVHKTPYEITCPYCGTHAKVMWRKKPYTKATKRDGWAISELRTAIIATHSQSRLGFMLQLQFGKT